MKRIKTGIPVTALAFAVLAGGPVFAAETTGSEGVESGAGVSNMTTTTDTTTTDTTPTSTQMIGTSVQTEAKLSQEFAEFLGSEEQAAQVVEGLRQGSSFSLSSGSGETETTAGGEGDTAALEVGAIEPPTGTMGYGNVKLTLRLAESKLQQMGITQPTPDELSAVLLGGDVNGQAVDGILAMRAEGMGWGEIAQQYDMKVGQIMGNGHGVADANAAAQAATETATTTTASTASGNGYIPSSSTKSAPGLVRQQSNGYIASSKGQHGRGIISANGASVQQASYQKSNGKAHTIKANNSYTQGNKHGYIASGSAAGGAGAARITSAAAVQGGAGKARGHVNKK